MVQPAWVSVLQTQPEAFFHAQGHSPHVLQTLSSSTLRNLLTPTGWQLLRNSNFFFNENLDLIPGGEQKLTKAVHFSSVTFFFFPLSEVLILKNLQRLGERWKQQENAVCTLKATEKWIRLFLKLKD